MTSSLWRTSIPAAAAALFLTVNLRAQDPVDGKFPPPKPPEGNWESLLAAPLEDHWTGMSMSVKSPLISTTPNPDKTGDIVLHIARGPTGLIRSLKPFEMTGPGPSS